MGVRFVDRDGVDAHDQPTSRLPCFVHNSHDVIPGEVDRLSEYPGVVVIVLTLVLLLRLV